MSAAALPVAVVRSLLLAPPAEGPKHLGAASGLVVTGGVACVVADDEHSLGCFGLGDDGPGRLLPLVDEALPPDHEARKVRKADFEALAALPALESLPHGALLIVGSGSKPARHRGVLVPLDEHARPDGHPRPIDLTALYAPLHAAWPELNIEGLFVSGDDLCLLQRGSRVSPSNACIRFRFADIAAWLAAGGPSPSPTSIETYPLGHISGVPLTFTDGTGLPGGGWLFSAAAEDTADSYQDGACAGSAVGLVDRQGRLHGPFALAAPAKVEGIALDPRGGPGTVLLVTDADDRRSPAWLLRADLAAAMPVPQTR